MNSQLPKFLAKQGLRKKAAVFLPPPSGPNFSVTPDHRGHCAIFLPLWCGRSGRSSKSKLLKAEKRRPGRGEPRADSVESGKPPGARLALSYRLSAILTFSPLPRPNLRPLRRGRCVPLHPQGGDGVKAASRPRAD